MHQLEKHLAACSSLNWKTPPSSRPATCNPSASRSPSNWIRVRSGPHPPLALHRLRPLSSPSAWLHLLPLLSPRFQELGSNCLCRLICITQWLCICKWRGWWLVGGWQDNSGEPGLCPSVAVWQLPGRSRGPWRGEGPGAGERAGREGQTDGQTARRQREPEEPVRECREQAPKRPRWQEQPARRALSEGDLQLQYDFGGILGWRAEDRKVRRPESLPELFSPTACAPGRPRCARFDGQRAVKSLQRAPPDRLALGSSPRRRWTEERAPNLAEPPGPLQKGRRDCPCPCGSCGWQPVAAPSARNWQRPRGRVTGGLLGVFRRAPVLWTCEGSAGVTGPGEASGLQKAGRHGGARTPEGESRCRGKGLPWPRRDRGWRDPLCSRSRVGWIRWGMPSRKCSAKPWVSAPSPSGCTRRPSCSTCKWGPRESLVAPLPSPALSEATSPSAPRPAAQLPAASHLPRGDPGARAGVAGVHADAWCLCAHPPLPLPSATPITWSCAYWRRTRTTTEMWRCRSTSPWSRRSAARTTSTSCASATRADWPSSCSWRQTQAQQRARAPSSPRTCTASWWR